MRKRRPPSPAHLGTAQAARTLDEARRALARQDFDEAGRQFERLLQLLPDHPDVLANLGAVRARQERLDEAIAALEAAVALSPGHPVAVRNLVITRAGRGTRRLAARAWESGAEDLRRALALDPSSGEQESALGLALAELGRLDEAVVHQRRALALVPDNPVVRNRLGLALMQLGRPGESRTVLEPAAAMGLVEPMVNLAAVCFELGCIEEAEAWSRRSIQRAPGSAEAHNNLGLALREQGDARGALAHFEQACALAPGGFIWQSGRLLTLNSLPDVEPSALVTAHRQVGQAWVAAVGGATTVAITEPDPDRPLRVGYVSPDLRTHSVGYFVESFLGCHDRAAVEATCYHCSPVKDAATRRLEQQSHRWRDVPALTDDALRALIISDGIDVLVDLAGHTARNRLAVFARRAAPVQMTYLGYGVTTGLPTMDYLLSDDIADPRGDEPLTEEVLRLAGGYLCYRPPFGPDGGPPVQPSPARRNGHVTFGSFNNLAKLNEVTLDLWADVLTRLPTARLLLKARGLEAPGLRARLEQRLAARGITPTRIALAPPTPNIEDHLALYGEIDLALDTFPYTGTTTTCEALWMGVPVVTLSGRTHMSRVSHSILGHLHADELVATNPTAYVEVATALASDLDRLEDLRRTLRPRLLGSPLMDGPRLARALEGAFRQAWRRALDRARR